MSHPFCHTFAFSILPIYASLLPVFSNIATLRHSTFFLWPFSYPTTFTLRPCPWFCTASHPWLLPTHYTPRSLTLQLTWLTPLHILATCTLLLKHLINLFLATYICSFFLSLTLKHQPIHNFSFESATRTVSSANNNRLNYRKYSCGSVTWSIKPGTVSRNMIQRNLHHLSCLK